MIYPVYPNIGPQTDAPIIVEINARIVPVVISALERYKFREFWTSDEDFQSGVREINKLQEGILTGAQSIVEAIDRLTRYVDTAFNGTQYTLSIDGIVLPAIAPIPPTEPSNDLGALRRRLLATQGVTGGFFGIGATPVTLASLLQAGRINTTADEGLINDGIEEVLNTVGSGGSIATALSNLLATGADVASDGGLAAVQIAAAVAQQATAGLLGAQVDRLVKALDGGGLASPAGAENNVLQLLRDGLLTETVDASEQPAVLNAAQLIELRLGSPPEERIQDILSNNRTTLATIAGQLVDPGSERTAGELLADIRAALRSLAGLESAGLVATGSALALQLEILNCICEGVSGTPTPEPGLNPEPTTDCFGGAPPAYVRATALNPVAVVEGPNGETLGAYSVQFPLNIFQNISSQEVFNGRYIYNVAVDVDIYQMCDAWDFTGGDLPVARSILMGPLARTPTIPDVTQYFFDESNRQGSFQTLLDTTIPGTGTNEFTVIYFWEEGKVPTRNIFFKGRPEPV